MSAKASRTASATPAAPESAPVGTARRREPHEVHQPHAATAWPRDFARLRNRHADQPVPEHGLPQTARDVVRRPGTPLPASVRANAEQRFGHDFSHVRVHTDPQAARAAAAMRARAFTVGHHIAFAAARFAPTTPAGDRLLTHELAHVVQQDYGRTQAAGTASAEAEAAALASDGSGAKKVRVGTGIGVHRSGDHQVLEADTHAFYYPPAYRPQKFQPGVDLVLGGSQPEYAQTTDRKTGRVEVTERVRGGTWIQIKRLTERGLSVDKIKERVIKNVNEGISGFRNALAHPEKAVHQAMDDAQWENKKPKSGTWNRTILTNPKRLLVHVEVPGFANLSAAQQLEIQKTANLAAKGTRFGRISFDVVVVDTPPPSRGLSLGRVRFTGSMAGRLAGVLTVLTTFTKLVKALDYMTGPYQVYRASVDALWVAEQAGKQRPFILVDETQNVKDAASLLHEARAEQEAYGATLRDLPAMIPAVVASGDLDNVGRAALSLLSAATILDSRLQQTKREITRMEAYRSRAEQRRDVADLLLKISLASRVIHPSTAAEVDVWKTREDLQHLINHTDNGLQDARVLRDRLTVDHEVVMAQVLLLKEWYAQLEAQQTPDQAQPATSTPPPQ
ncbi:DUF4157 domain-containing protein [Streptomyces sp. NPDC049837]|uniref:eCIS core domain-containing protein n=1 Tax=Streptomyces sp. NPDC049837 TaxID=3155277 RepID=UPI00344A2359